MHEKYAQVGDLMICPLCHREMVENVLEGVTIDVCLSCMGVWLDKGELKQLAGLDPKIGRVLNCPRCTTEMQTRIVDRIEIDICNKCGSIYLDQGELEKLTGLSVKNGKMPPLGEFFEREFLRSIRETFDKKMARLKEEVKGLQRREYEK
jgi:Zn-finger nucleic acid-binding protein